MPNPVTYAEISMLNSSFTNRKIVHNIQLHAFHVKKGNIPNRPFNIIRFRPKQ